MENEKYYKVDLTGGIDGVKTLTVKFLVFFVFVNTGSPF
jgi:hypothetical protein